MPVKRLFRTGLVKAARALGPKRRMDVKGAIKKAAPVARKAAAGVGRGLNKAGKWIEANPAKASLGAGIGAYLATRPKDKKRRRS